MIIVGDNDLAAKSKTLKVTMEAQAHLRQEGVETTLLIPNQMKKKTDWNDVHTLKGLAEVRRQLGLENNVNSLINTTYLDKMKSKEQVVAKFDYQNNQYQAHHLSMNKVNETLETRYDNLSKVNLPGHLNSINQPAQPQKFLELEP